MPRGSHDPATKPVAPGGQVSSGSWSFDPGVRGGWSPSPGRTVCAPDVSLCFVGLEVLEPDPPVGSGPGIRNRPRLDELDEVGARDLEPVGGFLGGQDGMGAGDRDGMSAGQRFEEIPEEDPGYARQDDVTAIEPDPRTACAWQLLEESVDLLSTGPGLCPVFGIEPRARSRRSVRRWTLRDRDGDDLGTFSINEIKVIIEINE